MHEAGFVFLDLKPNNILVGDSEGENLHKIRLIDFGISKPWKDEQDNHIKFEKTNLFMGSFIYSSFNGMNYIS